MSPRVGTVSLKASWGNRQDGEPRSRRWVECLPGPALATHSQEVQTVPRGPSEGRGSFSGLSDCLGRAGEHTREAGGWAADSWKGSLMKTPYGDHLGERLTFPMCS